MRKEKIVMGVIIGGALLLIFILNGILSNDMEKHIQKVSEQCASEGKGIEAYYTKEGDKFYGCKEK